MDLKKLFSKRVNVLFGLASLFCVLQVIILLPSQIAQLVVPKSELDPFWLDFIIPQLLYPILSVGLFLFAYKIFGLTMKSVVKTKKAPVLDYVIFAGMMLALSTVLSAIVNVLFEYLSGFGLNFFTVEESLVVPKDPISIIFIFIVMAVLPAICEEYVFRFTMLGTLAPLSRGGAILVSSIAFGLVHATLQQTPATFMMGILLAYAYLRTEDYRVPVVAHFVNNGTACAMMVISEFISEKATIAMSKLFVFIAISFGVVCTIMYFIRKSKRQPETEPQAQTPDTLKTGTAFVSAMKAPLFWVFVVLYLILTVVGIISFNLTPAM